MKSTSIIKKIFIIFTALTCMLLYTSAYAQDLEVTMDVVQEPDKKDATESMMNKIEMPKAAQQTPENRGDMERGERKRNEENMMRSNENMDNKAREHRDRSREQANDAKMDRDKKRNKDMMDSHDKRGEDFNNMKNH